MLVLLVLAGCSKPKPQTEDRAGTTKPTKETTESTQSPNEFKAKVMKAVDGDTLKVVDRDFQTLLVQLNGVDAPELAQDFGTEAQAALAKHLEGKIVRVVVSDRDELNRIAGEIYHDDRSVNVWVIEQGFGWYNHKYDTDEKKSVAETEARAHSRGLWSSDTPIPPWVWKNPPDDGRLYVQGNGTRYHRANCDTLDGRRRPISLEEAIESYTPCQRCKPPQE